MLALGVVIVSRSRSFATDVTAILFGDVLAIRPADLVLLAVALVVLVGTCAALHRPFVAVGPEEATGAVPAGAHAFGQSVCVLRKPAAEGEQAGSPHGAAGTEAEAARMRRRADRRAWRRGRADGGGAGPG